MTLPLAPKADQVVPERQPDHEPSSADGLPQRVLVVDDNSDAAETLALLLEASGHTTAVAHDGASALAQAEVMEPGVILLDIGLPEMDGYEVAKLLRQNPRSQNVILAALTGHWQARDRERAHAAAFNRHFTKLVNIGVLNSFISSARSGFD